MNLIAFCAKRQLFTHRKPWERITKGRHRPVMVSHQSQLETAIGDEHLRHLAHAFIENHRATSRGHDANRPIALINFHQAKLEACHQYCPLVGVANGRGRVSFSLAGLCRRRFIARGPVAGMWQVDC